jgi:hypothetical protein
MKENFRKIGGIAMVCVLSLVSCNNSGNDKSKGSVKEENGSGVTLLLKDADLMQVDSNPQYNTAEWSFVVKQPGRYDIWLSSLTCDTSNVLFASDVTITAGDTRIEKRPVSDQIITDDKNVKSPWVRADSHMGSVFFSEPGEYQVQVISDRVIPVTANESKTGKDKHTLINSLILKPTVN